MARYVLDPNDVWRNDAGWTFPDSGVLVQTRNLVDTRGGHAYLDGASRVSAPGKRTKIFKGETAWSDAERLAGDYALELRRENGAW